jgi:replicative DNA helicase
VSTYPESPPRPSAQIATGVAPPHSLEAEQSVLGGILLSDRAMYGLVIEEGLKPEDFYRDRHRAIYESMLALYRDSEPIDVLTVSEHLRSTGKLEEAGGKAAIDELTGGVPGLGGIRRYAQIVREHALMRRLLSTTYEIQASVLNHAAAPRDLVEQAERAMLEVAHDDRQKDFRTIDEILDDELKKMEKLSREGTSLTGTPSGFRDLDEITGGFQPGNLIVIAARPSMGKSALVTNIAENAAIDHGLPVALFSLEMSETELAQRFVASQGRIKGDELRKGRVPDGKWPKILKASARLAAAPLFVDDSSDVGIIEIRAKARRLHQQNPLGLIIIDYLQLMRPDGRVESRVQQVGEMSRGLKILARELNVPVIALSQLSRAVETRGQSVDSKRPLLSDLRECVTGDTLVTLADGRRRPIAELVGTTPTVLAVDGSDRVVTAPSDLVWPVGIRSVERLRLASGRTLTATREHRIRTRGGWTPLGDVAIGDRVAVARSLPEPAVPERWPDDRVVLLGHLIGDGSYLTHQPLRYTTASEENSAAVATAAEREFGATVARHAGRGNWHQLVISGNGNRWHPAGVNLWLRELGIWNERSAQKRVPELAFKLPNDQIASLLRHLWATDGTIRCATRANGRRFSRVSFATASARLAADVAALLLRCGIVGRVSTLIQRTGTPLHNVTVSGVRDQLRFLDGVGCFGPRMRQAEKLRAMLGDMAENTNVDTLPIEARVDVRARMIERGVTQRGMAMMRATPYGGTSHYRFAPSRSVALDYATLLEDPQLAAAAASDLHWDRVVAIEEFGEKPVFDLTVPGPSCWLADGIVSHNSGAIEQDADLVAFIFREEYYDKETERAGIADIIIAKHRNGAIGDVELTFAKEYPKFLNYTSPDRYA